MIFWTKMDSPLGKLLLVEEDGALIQVNQSGSSRDEEGIQKTLEGIDPDVNHQDTPFLNLVEAQLQEYFAGEREHFDLKYHYHGTEFQEAVWDTIATIDFGETLTYGEIAQRLDRPGASRAVGNACGKNPLSIVVPCHRVLASDGRIGGYSSGSENKKVLLELEGITYKDN